MNLSFLFYFDYKVPVAGFQSIFQIIHTALKPPRNTLTFVAHILVWPWVCLGSVGLDDELFFNAK